MALFNEVMEDVARRLLGEPNPAQSKPHRLRWGNRGSLEVNTRRGVFYDHECAVGGGVVGLIMHKLGVDKDGAVDWLRREKFLNGRAGTGFVIDEVYDYTNEDRELLYQVIRLVSGDPRQRFRQRRPDMSGGWDWTLGDVRRVIYRLPDVLEEKRRGPVLVPEGEKDVNNLVRLGYSATCNSGGACKWKAHHSEQLRDADVVLLPDADEAGWKHVNMVGASLTGIAMRVRVLMMPDGAKDVSEWLASKGGTKERLDELLAAAPNWVAPQADEAKAKAEAGEQDLLDALARADSFTYAKRRKKAAKQLGVRARDLDDEVDRRREDRAAAPLYGHWETPPWPETVDGDALLRDIILRIRRHVVCSKDAALATALWVMLSWAHDEVATYSPILLVTSPDPECGKTTLMGVVSFLMPRCIASVDISKAALYRAIRKWQPSFCIDEFDTVLAGSKTNEGAQELRAIINSGHTRGQGVIRCNDKTNEPEPFDTFASKAIGMVGMKLPPATISRCIIVRLNRKTDDELVEKFHHVDDPGLADLRGRLLRWATDNMDALRGAEPLMPDATFGNRRADNWRLQFAHLRPLRRRLGR